MKRHRTSTPGADPTTTLEASSAPARTELGGTTPNSSPPARIPREWAWHYRTLQGLRDRFIRAHAQHAAEATTPPDMLGVDVVDTAQEKSDRDLLWAEVAADEDKLFEIDCALQRIRDGVYGRCEETGNPIPPERLRAVPWTRFSRAVAAQHEQQRRPRG